MKKTDNNALIFIIAALAVVFVAATMDGTNMMKLFLPAPMLLVFGGAFTASLAGIQKSDMKNVKAILKKGFKSNLEDPQEHLERMVRLAEVARREGLLALEKAAAGIEDPFFRKGVEMTVDGVDPEEIREILEQEIEAVEARHKVGVRFFTDVGGFSPTLGIIGTVIGLVKVLGNLTSPNALGPAIASAFTATLWGILSANIIWLPLANKLRRSSELEIASKRLVLEGILAIQAGSSPRMVHARLQAYIPPALRVEAKSGTKEEAA